MFTTRCSHFLATVVTTVCLPPQVLLSQETSDTTVVKIEETEFDQLMSRVHATAAGDSWKAADWKDEKLEAYIEKLLRELSEATKRRNVDWPVKFDAVTVGKDDGRPRRGQLIVTRSFEASHVDDCIILADGNVKISSARDCVIIARGAVDLSSSSGNLVLAGHYIECSSDRTSGRGLGGATYVASVLISGGMIRMSSASKSVLSAPGKIEISRAEDVALVNCKKHAVREGFSEYSAEGLKTISSRSRHPLEDCITVTQVVRGSRDRSLAVIRGKNVDYVIRQGAALTDENGEPLTGFANWKLEFVTHGFALFSDGEAFASFSLGR